MFNSSSLSYFILAAYFHTGSLRYLFFILTALTYVVIVVSNVLLIGIICVNRNLHEPMYLLLCSLFVSELYGSTGVFPPLLLHILSDIHIISPSFCFLQIFCLYSYVNAELCNLAVMSYDRYLAICCPLQYHSYMSNRRVLLVIALIWFYSFVRCFINVCLTLRLTLCGNVIHSLYCHNFLVVRLACSDTTVNNAYGLLGIFLSVVIPLLLMCVSYFQILQVCLNGSGGMIARQKAISTCSPQLVSLVNFSFGCLFEIIQTRFDLLSLPIGLRLFLSLYFVKMQPLASPIIYGMKMSKIREKCNRIFNMKKKHNNTDEQEMTSEL